MIILDHLLVFKRETFLNPPYHTDFKNLCFYEKVITFLRFDGENFVV